MEGRRFAWRAVLFGVLIVAALAFMMWVIFIKDDDKAPVSNKSGQGNSTQKDADDSADSTESNDTSADSGSSSSEGLGGSTGESNSNLPVPRELADTGPGSVTAIFVGATLAGAVGHHVVMRRRKGVRNIH